jgi:SAM-dependent methyltransferase
MSRKRERARTVGPATSPQDERSEAPPTDRHLVPELYGTAFVTGGAVMVVEILGTRIIGPVFGVSLFVWSALLAVTLASLAVGYYSGGALADRTPTRRLFRIVVTAAGLLLGVAPLISYPVLRVTDHLGPRGGPLLSAALLFGPCLVVLGMVGPVAVRLATSDVRATGHRVGGVYAISTAGSLVATLVTAFVLIPSFETNHILLGTAFVLVLLGAVPMALGGRPAALTALLVPAIAIVNPSAKLPAGLVLVDRSHGPYGVVEVIDDTNRGVRLLRAEHSIIGGQFTQDRSACFSFLHLLESLRFMRPEAKELLQIGLGIGSLPAALKPYGIKADVVEIDPEVVRMAQQHFGFATQGQIYVEDARTFIRRTDRKYDIVVHDTFTGGATPEHLLSIEVLKQIHDVLRPSGVMALNVPGYLTGPKAAASWAVARTLRAVFPVVRAFRDSPPNEHPDDAANLVFFASDASLDFRIPDDARFENDSCRSILRRFKGWEVLQSVAAGPVITDRWNPLARLQLPVAEDHFAAMNELLPAELWLH